MNKVKEFLKKETVLCIALLLAVISMFVILPDAQYKDYVDFRTLALLFCLMVVMAGLQRLGFFEWIAGSLLQRVKSAGVLITILVLLCFVFAMFITNDVALITFVPFTFTVLCLLGESGKKISAMAVVTMQTIAANLGSMITPIGNPQNLYLYGKSGVSLGEFMGWMAPYALASFLMIAIWCVFQGVKNKEKLSISLEEKKSLKGKEVKLIIYLVLFAFSLLTVARVIEYPITLIVTLVVILFMDRKVIKAVDYSLLLTFIGFFVFIGNMGRIPAFYSLLESVVEGNEVCVAILSSQMISNVPAALLLSGFTDHFKELTIGVDLGGLGTLIASMASLISYKIYAVQMPEKKGKYLAYFTISNICFLAVLMILYMILRAI